MVNETDRRRLPTLVRRDRESGSVRASERNVVLRKQADRRAELRIASRDTDVPVQVLGSQHRSEEDG